MKNREPNIQKQIKFFSELIGKNFSMSEELAKAIGTVVVQALTENAKDDSLGLNSDLDDGGLDDMELGESDLPESSRDAGKVEEAEGPKAAPDLSQDFAELKSIVNHSERKSDNVVHYEQVCEFLSKN